MMNQNTVKHWCIQKLAEQINSCTVKSIPDPTGKLDWAVAEAFINFHGDCYISSFSNQLKSKDEATYSFFDFDREYGQAIWECFYLPLKGYLRPLYSVKMQ
jgi:hypothetical protein